jgi:hypothetical protein
MSHAKQNCSAKMITLHEIHDALANKRYAELRELWEESTVSDIEKCDLERKDTLRNAMIRAVVFRGTTHTEDQVLLVTLDSIARGLHPHSDPATMQAIECLRSAREKAEE